jgi:hypothetical protein
MRNSRGFYWGSILIIFGIVWLLRSLNLLHVNLSLILPYWPILLILAGLILIFSRSRTTKGIVGVLITLSVLGAVFNKTERTFQNRSFSWGQPDLGWNDHPYDEEEEEEETDEDLDRNYQEHRSNRPNGRPIAGKFTYEFDPIIEKAKFTLEAGAGSFEIDGTSGQLYEANTNSNLVGFTSNTTLNKLNKSAQTVLKMEEGNISFKNGNIKNEAKIKLNSNPIWNVDIGIGAGKGNFDLSEYKVEQLNISTGAANLKIRLGEMLNQSNVKIESGVAAVELKVPNSVGCEIRIEGLLNSNNFSGFTKISNGLYRTTDYEQASKKITIQYTGAVSSLNIDRY